MAQLLVYAGAVVIMLLFALMLTQKRETAVIGGVSESRGFVAGLTSLLLFVVFFRVVSASPWGRADNSKTLIEAVAKSPGGTAQIIGQEFFGTWLLPFEVASVLLLMALVGAIVLARRDA
jgi:NAD(P)H-quinone oxidoreductase subunit 6